MESYNSDCISQELHSKLTHWHKYWSMSAITSSGNIKDFIVLLFLFQLKRKKKTQWL